MSTLLSLDGLTALRGECPVVDNVSVSIGAGECVGLIRSQRCGQDHADARGTWPFARQRRKFSHGAFSLRARPRRGVAPSSA